MSISCSRGWSAGSTLRVERAKRIGSLTCCNARSSLESHTLLLDVQVWSSGMSAVVRAAELQGPVGGRLEHPRAGDTAALGVHLDPIDPLDVGGTSPLRHQRRCARAAVLVAPHDGVLDHRVAGLGRGQHLMPGDQRGVRAVVLEAAAEPRNVAAVEHRRVPRCGVGRAAASHRRETDVPELGDSGPAPRALGGVVQPQRVPARTQRAEGELPGHPGRGLITMSVA